MKRKFFTVGSKIRVSDKMQDNYSYVLSEPIGKNFDYEFNPELTPQQMLEKGVFEGHYLTDCLNEFPEEWFANVKLSPERADISLNYFKIKSRQPLKVWREKGWIIKPDPRGWFQWYCRYYLGRRIPEVDEKQIKRWRAFTRHKAQVIKNCKSGDLTCRPKQRQALLQWAYDPEI